MDITAAPPPASAASKYVIELADERDVLRETHSATWKTATFGEKEIGLWSSYPAQLGGSAGHIVRVKDAFHLTSPGAVIDPKGRMLKGSLFGGGGRASRIDEMPRMRPKRDGWMFYPDVDTPRMGSAALFCQWPGALNYAHFLLDSMVSLAMLDDVGALSRFTPISPVLDPWRKDLVSLFLEAGDRALTEVEAPIVRIDEAIFAASGDGSLHPPVAPLLLLRERLLSRAIAVSPRAKPIRRIYFMRNGARRIATHKQLFADLREMGFLVVDPQRLSVIEQILLVSRAQIIVGEATAPLANVLFAPKGARVIELQPGSALGGWLSRLCETIGLRWLSFSCPPPPAGAPLASALGASCEDHLATEALRAFIETTA